MNMHVCLVSSSCLMLYNPWTGAHQAHLWKNTGVGIFWLKDQTHISRVSCTDGELFMTKSPENPIISMN